MSELRRTHAGTARCAFIDRDGTILVHRHYLADSADVELLPGAAEGLRVLRDAGLRLAVVTNQSAVGRGLLDAARLDAIHVRMAELLAAESVALDAIHACPHRPEEGCGCRKPAPGMVERAARELGCDPAAGFVIGDNVCDLNLGRAVRATTVLVRTGCGRQVISGAPESGVARPHFVADDLREAGNWIAGRLERSGCALWAA